jgi:hypothetical protein
METNKTIEKQEWYSNTNEYAIRKEMLKMLRECPIPEDDLLQNIGLFISSKNMSRIMFMHHIYKLSLEAHGVIMEFGCRWGQVSSLFAAFRGMYEPFNRMKKIIAFDSFEGFPSLNADKDNLGCNAMHPGGLCCTPEYEKYLSRILELQELDNPMSHIKKFEVIKGDATKTVKKYLKDFPETTISLAFFDFDIYEPTKKALELIKDRVVKGSVLAFDEINDHDSPGETRALMDVWGLKNVRLVHLPFASRVSYFVVE